TLRTVQSGTDDAPRRPGRARQTPGGAQQHHGHHRHLLPRALQPDLRRRHRPVRLSRTPWFTLAGVLSLAVGLGAGLALFIFMNGLLYRPIQGRDTAEVQRLFTSTSRGSRYGSSSLADFRAFEAAPGVFRTACATARTRANVTVDGQTTPVPGAIMTG